VCHTHFLKGKGKKSPWMNIGVDGWMDGCAYLGMESSSQEVHLCPIVKVKACKV
jgi:hypothetical protein